MRKVGSSLYLDGASAEVLDTYTITEPGEDGESWTVDQLQDDAGNIFLCEEDGDELTLYRPVDPSQPEPVNVAWDYNQTIELKSAVHGKRSNVNYASGDWTDGRSILQIDAEIWQMDDYLVRYGPSKDWLARATTSASQLTPFELDQKCEPPRRIDVLGWVLLGLFAAWGAASVALGKPLGFDWGYWIVGGTLITITTFGHARRPRLALSASFGLFLLSAFVLVGPLGKSFALPLPGAATTVALLWLGVLVVLSLSWQRGFYIIADSATKAGFISLLVYTVGLLLMCLFDEDSSWLSSWWWYFRAAPYCYFWPPIFVGWLIYYYFDYRDVPLSERGFIKLRGRVVRHLASAQPLKNAIHIGDGADDLADALHLCSDPRVRALAPYRELLQEIAEVFRALAGQKISLPSVGATAEKVNADLKLLSEELSQMGPEGKTMRISPLLKFLASDNPEKDDFLEALQGKPMKAS
ncbi:MAG: hypothetical protein JRH20_22540 [Deltaproteobacteria bacterium]|nr:hypothetical protein [Deltaproteobacteria bacterium]